MVGIGGAVLYNCGSKRALGGGRLSADPVGVPADAPRLPVEKLVGPDRIQVDVAVGIGVLSPPRGAPDWGTESRAESTPAETDD